MDGDHDCCDDEFTSYRPGAGRVVQAGRGEGLIVNKQLPLLKFYLPYLFMLYICLSIYSSKSIGRILNVV